MRSSLKQGSHDDQSLKIQIIKIQDCNKLNMNVLKRIQRATWCCKMLKRLVRKVKTRFSFTLCVASWLKFCCCEWRVDFLWNITNSILDSLRKGKKPSYIYHFFFQTIELLNFKVGFWTNLLVLWLTYLFLFVSFLVQWTEKST